MSMKNTLAPKDELLLKGLLESNPKAVQEIYDLVLPTIIIWIKQNNGSKADARDVFQEALIAVFQKLQNDDLKLTCTLKSYLKAICKYIWLAKIRNRKNRKEQTLENLEQVEVDEDMEKRIENAERNQLFFKHFDKLDDKCRQILQWYFDKIPLKEIAKRLDTSEGYIKKRKFQCKEKLIQLIRKDPMYLELKN